jgi:hypothetical protein
MAAELHMDADVDVICNAGYNERSDDRLNSRNGHRARPWDTGAGTINLDIPKLRQGSYLPSLLEPRRRAEQALVSVICQAYVEGVSTMSLASDMGPPCADRLSPPTSTSTSGTGSGVRRSSRPTPTRRGRSGST